MTLSFLLLYSATVFIASIIPGPSMLLALTHGMRFGARRTIASALGNIAVTLIQASVSFAGLGAILIASEEVFQVIKFAGAAYLIYMGVCMFLSAKTPFSQPGTSDSAAWESMRKMFVQSALVTAGNPKAIVFFTAVFPQFIDPNAAYLAQSLVLMSVCVIIAFICFMMYALCGEKVLSVFSEQTVGKYVKRVIGTTFIASGVSLAVSRR